MNPARSSGRGHCSPVPDFEDAADYIAITLDLLVQVNTALDRPQEALDYLRDKAEFLEWIGRKTQVIETLKRTLSFLEAKPDMPDARGDAYGYYPTFPWHWRTLAVRRRR